MSDRRGSEFQEALAAEFGGLVQAEWAPRDARSLGLMAAGPNGINRVWAAEDIAAIIATFLLVRLQHGRFRNAGRRRLQDPEMRREIIADAVMALRFGHALGFEVTDGGPVTLTVRMRADAIQRLARLVDDWGNAREAAE